MTKYKSGEKNGSKLLIPAATLLLCVVALIGAGYAASVSSVTINDNKVGTDGIVLYFTDGENNINAGEFSTNATYDWGSDTVMDGIPTTTYYINTFEDKLIGSATLEINKESSVITHVNITYESETTSDYDSDMTTYIKVKNSNKEYITKEGDGSFNLDVEKNYVIELYLNLNKKVSDLSDEPTDFKYNIKIIATPIDAPANP